MKVALNSFHRLPSRVVSDQIVSLLEFLHRSQQAWHGKVSYGMMGVYMHTHDMTKAGETKANTRTKTHV